MDKDFLTERRQSLEEKFFHARETRLIERLKEEHERGEVREQLKAATGITDAKVLGELVTQGIKGETLVALTMVPLVQVAWADRQMDRDEKKAILEAAETSGLVAGSPAFELLDGWLKERPADDLMDAWVDYITALKESLNPNAFASLKTDITKRARGVAEAAGGYFGMGKVSNAERDVLARIESAFG